MFLCQVVAADMSVVHGVVAGAPCVVLMFVLLFRWSRQTCPSFTVLLLVLYAMQVITTIIYITDPAEGVPEDEVGVQQNTPFIHFYFCSK